MTRTTLAAIKAYSLALFLACMFTGGPALAADPVEDAAWVQRLSLAADPAYYGCAQRDMRWFYALDRVVWDKVRPLAGPTRDGQMRAVGMIDAARAGAADFAQHFHVAKPCETAVNFLALAEVDDAVAAAEKIGGNVDLPQPHTMTAAMLQYPEFGQIIGIRLECGQRSAAWAAAARAKLAPDVAGQNAFINGKLDAGDTAYLRGYEAMMERWGHWEVTLIRPQLCGWADHFPNAGLVDAQAPGLR